MPTEKWAPKTDVWMKPNCVLLTCSVFWKCLFNTSSIAWQNPQMKNRVATMMKAKSRAELLPEGVWPPFVVIARDYSPKGGLLPMRVARRPPSGLSGSFLFQSYSD